MDISPIWISLRTAALSMFFTFFLGVFAAWGVVSVQNRKLRAFLDGILILPLVLPPTVAGYFLLMVFGIKRPVGIFLVNYFGIKIPFSWTATVVAATVIAFPLMYRSARGALEQVNENTVYAARTLGISEWSIFWHIRMRDALPGAASGGILSFTRALGEFGATAMIAGNIAGRTRTLPLAIYSAVSSGDEASAGYYVSVILAISFFAILSMSFFANKEHRVH